LISSGDKSPNCTSWIVRSGALEYAKLKFDMITVVMNLSQECVSFPALSKDKPARRSDREIESQALFNAL
jgi:hypothetical protein